MPKKKTKAVNKKNDDYTVLWWLLGITYGLGIFTGIAINIFL